MKSAYELAMERLDKTSPTVELTDDQKAELASIDERYKAKIAEKELFLDGLIDKARQTSSYAELPELEQQRVREISALKNKCEEEKEAVRNAS